jgi:hypothetical protein
MYVHAADLPFLAYSTKYYTNRRTHELSYDDEAIVGAIAPGTLMEVMCNEQAIP